MVLGRPWNVTNGSEGSKQTYLFREEKKRPLEEAECEEMEFLCRSQQSWKFYQKLYASHNGFVSRAEMCRGEHGNLLTD